jgi:hypothetical protein
MMTSDETIQRRNDLKFTITTSLAISLGIETSFRARELA